MKRFLSVLMLVAILLSCCACAKKDAPAPTSTAPIVQDVLKMDPKELYGHIDESQPVDGVYKIWSLKGVQQLAKTPNATFEVLCHIDLEGATLAPIPEFTGEINGGNWTIKNFTVEGDVENFGFIGINKGNVHNVTLENVTFKPGSSAKNLGGWAGINEGKLLRCYLNESNMNVSATAENAACGEYVGINTGYMGNMGGAVNVEYTASAAANVGGLVGVAKGGTIEYVQTDGKLTVTGANKTTGLFVGDASDVIFVNCMFRGEDNSQDGKLFLNFTGNADDDELVVAENGLWRDNGAIEPLPEKVMAARNKVVQAMADLVTCEWRVKQDLVHTCTCQLSGCHGTYSTQFTYVGLPYNHKSSSLARFTYILNEDKTVGDWFYDLASYDGFDIYIGADCSSCVQQAWWTVSNSTDTLNTTYIPAAYGKGTIAVGPYKCDFKLTTQTREGVSTLFTAEYLEANDYQTIMESYAAMRPGDAIVNKVAAGGHTQMCATFPVIVRDQQGLINGENSYIRVHEMGGSSNQTDEANGIMSQTSYYDYFSFAWMYSDCYVPVTCEELLTGELEPVEAYLDGAVDGHSGMFTGRVHTNYHLDYVKLTIIDENGKEVLDHPMFTSTQKTQDYGGNYWTARIYTDWFDMAEFANIMTRTELANGKYTYKITACPATFDQIVVHEGSFTIG